MKHKQILALAATLSLSVLTGCSEKSKDTGAGDGSKQSSPPASVKYIEVQPRSIDRTDPLPGRVVSYQVADIRPQVSGIITSRLFKEGSYVEEGQKLYQIDPSRYEADLQLAQSTLEQANANFENAQALVERSESLFKTKAISEQRYDDTVTALKSAKANVSMAEAEVKLAQINLDYTSVHSPISGYISPSSVTKGALVTERQTAPLATVRQLDPVYVDLSQTAAEALNLQARLTAARLESEASAEFPVILFLNQSNETYPEKGVLNATDLAVDVQTGAIRLRSIFPNPNIALLPGMFVRASIEDVGASKQITVPQKSVRIGPTGEKSVWVVDSTENARERVIETGASYNNNWVVLSGLEAGDRVVVEGFMGLSEGAPVAAQAIDPKN